MVLRRCISRRFLNKGVGPSFMVKMRGSKRVLETGVDETSLTSFTQELMR